LFHGLRLDLETGFYHSPTRYLDVHAGRFVTRSYLAGHSRRDGLGNAFTYSGNNPVSGTDHEEGVPSDGWPGDLGTTGGITGDGGDKKPTTVATESGGCKNLCNPANALEKGSCHITGLIIVWGPNDPKTEDTFDTGTGAGVEGLGQAMDKLADKV